MAVAQRLYLPIANLRRLLSESATFQTIVGAGNATDALPYIYLGEASDDGTQGRPRAIVGSPGGRRLCKTSTTGWKLEGALFVALEFNTDPVASTVQDAYATFAQQVEDILDEMATLAGQDDYLDVIEFQEIEEPMLCDGSLLKEGESAYWMTEWHCSIRGM